MLLLQLQPLSRLRRRPLRSRSVVVGRRWRWARERAAMAPSIGTRLRAVRSSPGCLRPPSPLPSRRVSARRRRQRCGPFRLLRLVHRLRRHPSRACNRGSSSRSSIISLSSSSRRTRITSSISTTLTPSMCRSSRATRPLSRPSSSRNRLDLFLLQNRPGRRLPSRRCPVAGQVRSASVTRAAQDRRGQQCSVRNSNSSSKRRFSINSSSNIIIITIIPWPSSRRSK